MVEQALGVPYAGMDGHLYCLHSSRKHQCRCRGHEARAWLERSGERTRFECILLGLYGWADSNKHYFTTRVDEGDTRIRN